MMYFVQLAVLAPVIALGEAGVPSWASLDDECEAEGCALQALQREGLKKGDADSAWTEVMSALVPRIQKLVFENNELAVSKEMRDAMKGTCLKLDEYRTSDKPFSDDWQCAAVDNDNFGAGAYLPSERVIESLSEYAGISKRTFSKFHLRSNNESDTLYGKWCGMPAPPEYERPYGGPVGNRVFWEDCVMRNSGYFNALMCDTKDSYAVLGIAALNHGVCYPAHRHDNQEAYWQLNGPGWWRTWPDNFTSAPNQKPYSEIRMTSPKGSWRLHNHPGIPHMFWRYFRHRQLKGGLIHEMDTTHDDDFLLAVYWWGKPVDTEVNYAYSHAVQEQGSCFARYRAEHSDVAHSCPEVARPPWAVFRR